VVVTEKSITDAEDAAGRVLGREQIERQRIHFERPGDGLRNHRGVAAENAIRVECYVEPPAALLLDQLHCFARADRHRMPVWQRAAAFVRELGRIRRPAQECRRRYTGGGAGEQASARQLHRRLLFGTGLVQTGYE